MDRRWYGIRTHHPLWRGWPVTQTPFWGTSAEVKAEAKKVLREKGADWKVVVHADAETKYCCWGPTHHCWRHGKRQEMPCTPP